MATPMKTAREWVADSQRKHMTSIATGNGRTTSATMGTREGGLLHEPVLELKKGRSPTCSASRASHTR
eukprot:2210619-Lingulodinium_polyedra.AAC.1